MMCVPQTFHALRLTSLNLSDHVSLGMYPRSSYTELEERRRLETETSLLKTYLLEAHSENTGQRDILRLLQNGFWPGKVG